jgi:hypothetical protein
MTAPMTLPALTTQTTAFLLLDQAQENLLAALYERTDCQDCKASAGWCEQCIGIGLAEDVVGPAIARVRFCLSDPHARMIVIEVMDTLADTASFGSASEIAFFGAVAGGVR